MRNFEFADFNTGLVSPDISVLFPHFIPSQEAVCVISPHDDDAIIGAGYAIQAALTQDVPVYVIIVCAGNAGYSDITLKDTIVATRRTETETAYTRIGVPPERILRMEYDDFSAFQGMGWKLRGGATGEFQTIVSYLRRNKITRLLVPNHYREHIDHLAAHLMGTYDAAQAGDAVVMEFGVPHAVVTVLEYAVWSEFGPEDMLAQSRGNGLRANRAVLACPMAEDVIGAGLAAYVSQDEIIRNLTASRVERRLPDGRYLELYIELDPRPKLNYTPYRHYLQRLLSSS